ncbi:hypothetical protein TNIN_127511, partial [Trichonephila inaurata madagascariensis]
LFRFKILRIKKTFSKSRYSEVKKFDSS